VSVEWYETAAATGPLTSGGLSRLVKPARIYDLRSTFASNALAAGVTVFELAKVMGTSVAMIERHYGTLIGGAHAGIAGWKRLKPCSKGQPRTRLAGSMPLRGHDLVQLIERDRRHWAALGKRGLDVALEPPLEVGLRVPHFRNAPASRHGAVRVHDESFLASYPIEDRPQPVNHLLSCAGNVSGHQDWHPCPPGVDV
jgi:hypothetical protein